MDGAAGHGVFPDARVYTVLQLRQILLQQGSGREGLQGRARFVRLRYSGQIVSSALAAARRRQQLALLGLDDQQIPAVGARLRDGVLENRCGKSLQLGVDGQVDVHPGSRFDGRGFEPPCGRARGIAPPHCESRLAGQ